MATATPRPDWSPGIPRSERAETLADWLTRRAQGNPNFKIPTGYRVSEDGTRIEKIPPSFMNRNPWLYPVMGMAGGAGLAAAAGSFGGAAAAGGAAGSGTLASTTTAPLAGALPAGGAGLGAGAATAGGAGTVGTLATGASATDRILRAGRSLASAAPLIGALRGNGRNDAPDANGILASNPQLQELLNLQMGQAKRADPLHEALVKLSTRLLPNSSR